jgi:hypothetical protein
MGRNGGVALWRRRRSTGLVSLWRTGDESPRSFFLDMLLVPLPNDLEHRDLRAAQKRQPSQQKHFDMLILQ